MNYFKNEKNLYIVVGIVSVLGCGILYFSSRHNSETSKVTFGQVDKLRQETKIKNELARKKVSVDNYRQAPALNTDYRPVDEETAVGRSSVVLESEKHSVTQDVNEEDSRRQPVSMLEAQINKKLVIDQKAEQMSVYQKKQFIENYKKNALAAGYLVELSDQLVVTKVQKISRGQNKGPASIPQEEINIQEEEYEDEEAE